MVTKTAKKAEADSISSVGVRVSDCVQAATAVGEWQGVIRNVTYRLAAERCQSSVCTGA